MLLGQQALAGATIEPRETGVAVSDERAHATLIRQDQSLPVLTLSNLDVERLATRGDLTEEPGRVAFDAALTTLTTERERPLGVSDSGLGLIRPQTCLPKPYRET